MNTLKKKLLAFLANFHPYFKVTPVVDDVIADFNKVVKALEEVTAHHTIATAVHDEAIRLATEAKAFAEAEAARAKAVADKVRNLFSA